MSMQTQSKIPKKVDVAVKLMYLSVAVSFLSNVVWHSINIFRYEGEPIPAVGALVFNLLVAIVLIFLVRKISQGRNWARLLGAFLVLGSILSMFCPVGAVTAVDDSLQQIRNAFEITGYVFFALEFIAIILLFWGDSNDYFRTKKEVKSLT